MNKVINKEKKYFLISIFIILVYLSPFFILQENVSVSVHDYLDSAFVNYKTLVSSNKIFSSSNEIIEEFGIRRGSLPSEFNLNILLFSIFPPFIVYVIQQILIHFIGFFGMLLLLKNYCSLKKYLYIIYGVSVCFAIIPYNMVTYLNIAGIPLILNSFFNIRKKEYLKRDWLIICLFPFYSLLFYSSVFIIMGLFILWLWDGIRKKTWNKMFLISIILMSILYIGIEYRVFYDILFNTEFISNRVEYLRVYNRNFFRLFFRGLFFMQPHTNSYQGLITFSTIIIIIYSLIKRIDFRKEINKLFFKIIFLIILFLSLYCFFQSSFMNYFGLKEIIFFRIFSIQRFSWLLPVLWYILFAIILQFINRVYFKKGKILVIFLLMLQISYLFYVSDFSKEYRKYNGDLTYKSFFAENIFNKIKYYINKDIKTYRVASIGMHPSISQYNNFYTIDWYLSHYEIEYKYRFMKIMQKELDKNKVIRDYFTVFSGRLYLFTDELAHDVYGYRGNKSRFTILSNFLSNKNQNISDIVGVLLKRQIKQENQQIDNLQLDIKYLKEFNVQYILSRVLIKNQFKFLKKFEDKDSFWDIYLYKVE